LIRPSSQEASQKVTSILYPTRGGEPTYRNQDRAAALAQERDETLLLLYVANVHFLDHMAGPVSLDLVEKELDELGEFLLALAQERAEKAGVAVDSVVYHGEFQQSLIEVVQRHEVTAVFLGRPAHDAALTTQDFISNLARSLPVELGVEAFVVHEGEIVEHYLPPQAEGDVDRI
jgi:nucleotide-binding universal stress UspA family protein